ncbi:glycosyltransferase family 39 protein [Halovivax sp.]|uniref:glycosyltransferase family 39 protein n=1 Tax=Halovivax sp. TaxID=1935978 RepID=UPI0025C68ECF|nr:glycosyltransferase family 39 protein [Halovivax sp.]
MTAEIADSRGHNPSIGRRGPAARLAWLVTGAVVAAFLLHTAEVLSAAPLFRPEVLGTLALAVGAVVLAERHGPALPVPSRVGRALADPIDRVRSRPRVIKFVWLSTRNLVALYALLIVLSATRLRLHHHVDLSIVFYATVSLLGLTLLLRDDETARAATRAGAVLATVVAVAPLFSETAAQAVTANTYLLTAALVGLVLWQEGDRRERRPVRRTGGASERTGGVGSRTDGGSGRTDGAGDRSGAGRVGALPVADRLRRAVAGLDRRSYEVRGRTVPITAHGVGLAAVTLGAIGVIFYRLGELHLFGDEYLVVDAAASYYYTGELYLWNWIADDQGSRYYDRAWPHTLLVAASYAVFGISEWSARLVSALFGAATVPVAYVVFRYFTEDRTVALATAAALAIYPSTLFYFRWARMYALLIPLFLLLTYLVHRTTTEGNSLNLRNDRSNRLIDRYLDFNLGLGLLTLPVLYVAYQVHYNALLVLAVAYVYVCYRAVATREPKYRTASAIGTAGLAAVALVAHTTDRLAFLDQFLSFFARENVVYLSYLLRFPFEATAGVAFFLAGFALLARIDDEPRRQKLLFCYLLCVFALVFYVHVGDRYASFAYTVHVVPFAVALLLLVYAEFVRSMRSPLLAVGLVVLLVSCLVFPMYAGTYSWDADRLYHEDREDFRTAYGTIVDEYEEDDALFAQYARDYYLRELPEDAEWISMLNNQEYGPDEFHDDLERHDSGWVTWETGKTYHVHPEVREYVEENFEQRHGSGVDDTRVEVYYFDETMTEDRAETVGGPAASIGGGAVPVDERASSIDG